MFDRHETQKHVVWDNVSYVYVFVNFPKFKYFYAIPEEKFKNIYIENIGPADCMQTSVINYILAIYVDIFIVTYFKKLFFKTRINIEIKYHTSLYLLL